MTQPSDQESTPAQDAEESQNSADANLTDSESASETPTTTTEELESGLPDVEELTPEIVEEQAWRNDVMLRLAVVLLAFLMGFTAIEESATLVHIRSGEYAFDHGGLPPRTDVFSFTASGQEWVNRNWLFDVILAGVHQISPWALTVFKSLIAAGAFWLLIRIRLPEVPTWWGSVCGVLALVTCLPLLTARPELMTLLGTVVTLWLLHRWRSQHSGVVFAMPILFLVWANLDPRMFLGLVLLIVFAVGETVQHFIRQQDDAPSLKTLWISVAGALVASIVHPFGWQTLLAPWDLYQIVYPALRDALPLIALDESNSAATIGSEAYWSPISPATIAGVTVIGLGFVAMALNWRRVRISHLLMIVVAAAAAGLARHELGFAAIVAAAIGTLNAQQWYCENFQSEYSTALRERLFSVGGRAVTALAFMMLSLAFLIGRLDFGRRAGVGFSAELQQNMQNVIADTEVIPKEHRGLNVSYRDGDLLIWAGRKSCIDSRLELFAQVSSPAPTQDQETTETEDAETDATQDEPENLLETHQQMFASLDAAIQGKGDGKQSLQAWIDGLNDWDITHFYVPFLQPRPAYNYYVAIVGGRQPWILTELGTAYAVLYRTDVRNEKNQPDRELQKYIREHLTNPSEEVYRADIETPPAPLLEWPQPQPWLTEQLYGLPITPAPTQRAVNYNIHMRALVTDQIATITFAHIVIRDAIRGIAENPSAAESYRLLAEAYWRLNIAEQQFNAQYRPQEPLPQTRRYFQSISACYQALSLNPDDRQTRQLLMTQYELNNRPDLLIEQMDWFLDHWEVEENDNETTQSRRRVIEEQREKIAERIKAVRSEIDKRVTQGMPIDQAARFAYERGGCVQVALDLLDSKAKPEDGSPPPMDEMFLRIQLNLESGRVPEALEFLRLSQEFMAQSGMDPKNLPWQQWIAFLDLSMYRHEEAATLLQNESDKLLRASLQNLMATLPLATRPVEPFPWFMQLQDEWVVAHTMLSEQTLAASGPRAAQLLIESGLTYLEFGQSSKAGELFQRALEIHPETAYRPLMAFYIGQITDEVVRLIPPSLEIPIWGGMFAEEPETTDSTSPAKAEKPKD